MDREVKREEQEEGRGNKEYYDVEMSLDEGFEGEREMLENGRFVSFKYVGEYDGKGPPTNPRISFSSSLDLFFSSRFIPYFFFLFSFIESRYMQLEMTFRVGSRF